uniref:Ubiquitin thioesterase OTU n=1 Tax=Lotharella oceanica TaxID=641309 RepID=A0A7S2TGW4_9EUKA|mmetsp:Transcript_13746/g.26214  ORF Transcript_13746/g.26214 Transcript_13746/m.26214 type:complete len:324 (+) Transcript_13746:44-1015(+)
MPYKFRLRAKGKQCVLGGIADTATVGDLKARIEKEVGIAAARQSIKHGYPPSELKAASTETLKAASVRSGVTLIVAEVEPKAVLETKSQPAAGGSGSSGGGGGGGGPKPGASPCPPASVTTDGKSKGLVMKRVTIPDDNSCLFTAVGYACETPPSMGHASTLRQVCASLVIASGYTEAFLGKPPNQYSQEIMNPSKWGGGIELAMLSQYYQMEITAVDVMTLKPYIYSEGKGYKMRVYLVYNGIHYDVVSGTRDGASTCQFSPSDTEALAKAIEIAREARAKKQFVDVATFTLKCADCDTGLKGAKEAQEHAKATGHRNFTQY